VWRKQNSCSSSEKRMAQDKHSRYKHAACTIGFYENVKPGAVKSHFQYSKNTRIALSPLFVSSSAVFSFSRLLCWVMEAGSRDMLTLCSLGDLQTQSATRQHQAACSFIWPALLFSSGRYGAKLERLCVLPALRKKNRPQRLFP